MSDIQAVKPLDHKALYKLIADEIIHFHWKPGELVTEKTLCDRYGVPRTQIHSVLQHLQDHHLLTVVPHRGSVVSKLDMNVINQLIYERLAVETMVLRDFIAQRTDEDKQTVQALFDTMRKSIERYHTAGFDAEAFLTADRAMHSYWFHRMRCDMLWDQLSRTQASHTRFVMLDINAGDNAETVVSEHGEMVKLIKKGTSEGLEDLLRRHLYGCVKRIGPMAYTTLQSYFEPITEDMNTPRA